MPPVYNENNSGSWDIYLASGVGAFCLYLGDLVKNNNYSTVMRISEAIRIHLASFFGETALCAILLLILLGIVVCWIHSPSNRIEGFARGFSVFAVLAVASPAVKDSTPLITDDIFTAVGAVHNIRFKDSKPFLKTPPLSFYSTSAFAQTFSTANREGETTIIMPKGEDNSGDSVTTVTLRDFNSEEIVARQDIDGSMFRIKKSYGSYLLEIERPGFQRTMVSLTIDKPIAAYNLAMVQSNIPLSIQKLVAPSGGIK